MIPRFNNFTRTLPVDNDSLVNILFKKGDTHSATSSGISKEYHRVSFYSFAKRCMECGNQIRRFILATDIMVYNFIIWGEKRRKTYVEALSNLCEQ